MFFQDHSYKKRRIEETKQVDKPYCPKGLPAKETIMLQEVITTTGAQSTVTMQSKVIKFQFEHPHKDRQKDEEMIEVNSQPSQFNLTPMGE